MLNFLHQIKSHLPRFFRLPRPGGKPGIFMVFIYFLSRLQCLRPLGYCATPFPRFFVKKDQPRTPEISKESRIRRKINFFFSKWIKNEFRGKRWKNPERCWETEPTRKWRKSRVRFWGERLNLIFVKLKGSKNNQHLAKHQQNKLCSFPRNAHVRTIAS